MKSLPKIYLFILSLLILTVSCRKEIEYPMEPVITYESFYIIPNNGQDKALLIISFTDGDGDIGLTDEDTISPYIDEYHYNYFITIFKKENGIFEEVVFPDSSLTFNSRIPYVPMTENNKGIKGEIEISLEWYLFKPFLDDDTIYFDSYIVDRALHKSNIVSSPKLIVK